ncbi:MAG: lactonase family protein [Opitutales bacterium]
MTDAPAQRLLFGTYTGETGSLGIYSLTLEGLSAPKPTQPLARADNPSFLARHPTLPVLYAVTEAGSFHGQPGGGVQAWMLATDGSAESLGGQPTGAGGPCHLAVHPAGRLLVTANYRGGSVSVFPLQPDGVVGTNRGHDSLAVFSRDPGSGRLGAPRLVDCGGPGPRHATFLPGGRVLLVAHRQGDTVQAFAFDPETGDLSPEGKPIEGVAPVCVLWGG